MVSDVVDEDWLLMNAVAAAEARRAALVQGGQHGVGRVAAGGDGHVHVVLLEVVEGAIEEAVVLTLEVCTAAAGAGA